MCILTKLVDSDLSLQIKWPELAFCTTGWQSKHSFQIMKKSMKGFEKYKALKNEFVDCDPKFINRDQTYLGFCITSSPNLMINIKYGVELLLNNKC